MARVLEATAPVIALDRDGISLSQTVGAAADLLINGVGASGGIATLTPPRPVSIYAAGDETGKTFTIYGTDRAGTEISEVVTGPNATTTSSNKIFKTVTRIAVSAALAGNVEAGWTAVSYTRWIFAANSREHYSLMLRYIMRATATYDVQATSMEMNRADSGYAGGDHPDDISTIRAGISTSLDEPLVVPFQAFRLRVTAQTGDVVLRLYKSITG